MKLLSFVIDRPYVCGERFPPMRAKANLADYDKNFNVTNEMSVGLPPAVIAKIINLIAQHVEQQARDNANSVRGALGEACAQSVRDIEYEPSPYMLGK